MKKYSFSERYGMLRSRISIIVKDLKTKTNIPINKRLNLLIKGYYSWHNILYDLSNNNINDFLSEYQRRKTRFINGQASYILSDKLICNQILKQYVKIAEIYSIILDGNIYCVDEEKTIDNYVSLLKYIKEIGPLILKPNIGTDSGRGVILVKYENDNIIFNSEKVSFNELEMLIKSLDKYIVCEFVKQGKHGDYLYKDTVNTIRILTMIDPFDHKPFIVAAVHRIGNKKSIPVDNGSYSAKVDLDTGTIGKAVVHNNIKKLEWFSKHPETGAQIEGVIVPNWEKVSIAF